MSRLTDGLAEITLISNLASAGLLTVIYGKVRKLDNLAQLHAKYHPEDAGLVK